MDISSFVLGILIGTTLLAGLPLPAGDLYEVDVQQLARVWEQEHVSPADPYTIKHADLQKRLKDLAREFPGFLEIERAGSSVEGRAISLVRLGSGPRRILLWSQMHGNEPTATASLLDLFQFFGRHRQDPWVAEILRKFTLLCIPMLNPDGAERNQRRNVQEIDINRDARMLQSPEGLVLKAIRDRYRPFLGFNLHNQNGLTTVGDTGKVATIALLAVAADVPGARTAPASLADAGEGTIPPELAKRVTAVLYDALSPFAYGHISRYDEEFNPRAFGDNITLWGTPVVLIESGGTPAGQPLNFTVKLNFVGILAVLNSLATGRIAQANPAVFDALKLNSSSPIYSLMLHNAWVSNGTAAPLFRADIAIRGDMRAGSRGEAVIADVGDLGVFSAHETIDCTGLMVTPGLIAWDPGRRISSPAEDGAYLRRGILTVIETAPWEEIAEKEPAPKQWRLQTRGVNWGFLVAGEPSGDREAMQLRLAEWLAAGGRAWVSGARRETALSGFSKIPGWFGVDALARAEAAKFEAPPAWSGAPSKVISEWSAEAARAFHLSRRGTIAPGAAADLVVWKSSGGGFDDMRGCTPVRVILNGKAFDLANRETVENGRFLRR